MLSIKKMSLLLLLGLYSACGFRSPAELEQPKINLSFDYIIGDAYTAIPIFDGIRFNNNFKLYYHIHSSKALKQIKINLGSLDLNYGDQPIKEGSHWIDLDNIGVDGMYDLDVVVIDQDDRVTHKSIKVFKNTHQYEYHNEHSFIKAENIGQHEAKFFEVGDINLDGYMDAFLHIDSQPKILLGPDFQNQWDVSEEHWYSSTYNCDVNGDGIQDIVLGNRYHGTAGKIKVYFGPMLNNKTFTESAEYHGAHTYSAETGYFYEYAGAKIGCANLEGGSKGRIMQFNGNAYQENFTVLPAKLDFFVYNKNSNTLSKDDYTEYSSLHSQYPSGIFGDANTYFSNSKDINFDGHDDIIINGWYKPDSNDQEKVMTVLYGGKNKSYYLGEAIHSRHIFDDILDQGIAPYVTSNSFPKARVSILEDVNLDSHLDYNLIYNQCISSQTSCNYSDFNYLEMNQIVSDQQTVYLNSHNIVQDEYHLQVKSFDFDGDGFFDYLFLNRNPSNHALFFDVKLSNSNETLNYLTDLQLGESNEQAVFLPIKNNLNERFLLFVQSNSQGNWQNPSVVNIKIYKDE
ncbi:VCBS repeat-containing protein [bacterium]|nr:VCBS repeat-containing protein [bacterium]